MDRGDQRSGRGGMNSRGSRERWGRCEGTQEVPRHTGAVKEDSVAGVLFLSFHQQGVIEAVINPRAGGQHTREPSPFSYFICRD